MKTIAFLSFFILASCSSTYYAALEQVGIPKRDLLSKRVQASRDAQEDAKEQFKNALEAYRSVVTVEGGELDDKYQKLNSEYEDSLASATKIKDRISKVESVAEALFEEWEEELALYQSPNLRRQSENKLRATRERYVQLVRAMRKASEKTEPVLLTLRDQVTYLKHNLNSRAIGALEDESAGIEYDVDKLISALQDSIDEAAQFISELDKS